MTITCAARTSAADHVRDKEPSPSFGSLGPSLRRGRPTPQSVWPFLANVGAYSARRKAMRSARSVGVSLMPKRVS